MIERTTLTVTSTSATGFGAEQHEETRIIPRQATIQDLIDMLELCDTSDRVDQVTITGEEPVKDLYMVGTDGQAHAAEMQVHYEHPREDIRPHVPGRSSDGRSDPYPSPSEGGTGKREEGPKEEHMEAMRREAEQLFKQWEKTRRLL